MKIGIIGTDPVIVEFINAANKCLDVEVHGLYTPNSELLKTIEDHQKVKWTTDSFESLLAHEEIDTIYVAQSENEHFKTTKTILEAGKNAIVEKPMALHSKEMETLIQLAKTKNVYLFESVSNIHYPNYARIKENLKDLGEIQNVELAYTKENPLSLIQLNAYNLHFAIGLFGKPKSIEHNKNHEITMTYDGFSCHCKAEQSKTSPSFASITGKNGNVSMEGPMNACETISMNLPKGNRVFSDSEKDRMVYEVIRFQEIIRRSDQKSHEALLERSLYVSKVLETLGSM